MLTPSFLKKCIFISLCLSFTALAKGGVSVMGTRIIFPESSQQQFINARNSSQTDSFLVQSWVEDASGNKTHDFIVTPPLYLSGPGNENVIKIMHVAKSSLTQEKVYYFVEKTIPSVDNSTSSRPGSHLLIAAATRIKLFLRPDNLAIPASDAPDKLRFLREGEQLIAVNDTPYYLTVTNISSAGKKIKDVMLNPESRTTVASYSGASVTFQTINDAGGFTPKATRAVN